MSSSTALKSNWDAILVVLSIAHASVLWLAPSIPVIALGVWWNSNTISHNFLHLPFFKSRALNRAYSLYLTALLGIPQTLWRERHLAHHRGEPARLTNRSAVLTETGVILFLWVAMIGVAPRFFWATYLPGYAVGLFLCYLHGYFEHANGTISHYGLVYNVLFFNDGFHIEHHARPGEHWTHLPHVAPPAPNPSRWPAIFRGVEGINLERLEHMALRSPMLQNFLLRTHERAIRIVLAKAPPIRSVTIVGGGMYPRTALVIRKLLPDASLQILDADANHLEMAKPFLPEGIEFVHGRYVSGQPMNCDLLVIPLSFSGIRRQVYRNPGTRAVLLHDWIWAKHGFSRIVSLFLLKRVNLIVR
jgi:hypothetical protein